MATYVWYVIGHTQNSIPHTYVELACCLCCWSYWKVVTATTIAQWFQDSTQLVNPHKASDDPAFIVMQCWRRCKECISELLRSRIGAPQKGETNLILLIHQSLKAQIIFTSDLTNCIKHQDYHTKTTGIRLGEGLYDLLAPGSASKFWWPWIQYACFRFCGTMPKYPKKTHTCTGVTCKPHRKNPGQETSLRSSFWEATALTNVSLCYRSLNFRTQNLKHQNLRFWGSTLRLCIMK